MNADPISSIFRGTQAAPRVEELHRHNGAARVAEARVHGRRAEHVLVE